MKDITKKPDIRQWKPTKKQMLVEPDHKILIVHFDKIFGKPDTPPDVLEKYKSYNDFLINKLSCMNILPTIAHYINYFMNKYDPENELATAYLRMKFLIERYKIDKTVMVEERDEHGNVIMDPVYDATGEPIVDINTGEPIYEKRLRQETIRTYALNGIEDLQLFINELYRTVFTPSICEKIKRATDDNYVEDVECTRAGYQKSDKVYLEDLEFTNEHIIILHRLSYAMKIAAPVMFHFFTHHNIKPGKEDLTIYRVFEPMFDLLTNPGINIYNKLYIYVKTKVKAEAKYNQIIYAQREIMGVDTKSVIDLFVRIRVISDIMIKYEFDGSVLGLNKTVLKTQLMYFLKESYSKTLVELTNDKDDEGLSGADKMEMHMPKIDEGAVLYSEYNIERTIQSIKQANHIEISDEEIKYFRKHHKPTELQMHLVRAAYSSIIGQSRDLEFLGDNYYYLALLLRKQLLIESGVDPNAPGVAIDVCLPYILTGNLTGGCKQKQIKKASFLEEIYGSYPFKQLKIKYKSLCEICPNYFEDMLSKLIYSRYTYICYEAQNWTGKEIEVDERTAANEILTFLQGSI